MTGRGALTLIRQTSKHLNTPLPDAIRRAVESGDQLVERASQIRPGTLIEAALDALEKSDADPSSDKKLAGMVTGHILASSGIAGAARTRADQRIEQAIINATDEILEGWAQALTPHNDALESAAEQLPDGDLDDLLHRLKDDATALSLYSGARQAARAWASAVQGFGQVALASGVTVTHRSLVYTADSTSTIPHRADAWAVARAGLHLELPSSLDEWRERVDAHTQRALDAQTDTTETEDDDQPTRTWTAVRVR